VGRITEVSAKRWKVDLRGHKVREEGREGEREGGREGR